MVEGRKALSYLPDAGVWPEALSFCGEVFFGCPCKCRALVLLGHSWCVLIGWLSVTHPLLSASLPELKLS